MNRSVPLKSILVVEDDLSTSNLIERVIRSIQPGLNLEWTTTAEEAIKLINDASEKKRPCPFNLVISDFYLDGPKTGLDFWNHIQRVYPDVPFVLMSSTDVNDFLDDDETRTVPYFLRKPFDIGQCKAFLTKLIRS